MKELNHMYYTHSKSGIVVLRGEWEDFGDMMIDDKLPKRVMECHDRGHLPEHKEVWNKDDPGELEAVEYACALCKITWKVGMKEE